MTTTKTAPKRRTPAEMAAYHQEQAERHAHKARLASDPVYSAACVLSEELIDCDPPKDSPAQRLQIACTVYLDSLRPYDAPGVEFRGPAAEPEPAEVAG